MSKQLYDEIQSFLLDKWGPLGGWCQAVMFAADLPVTTTTPRKGKVMIKPENPPASPISTALVTPVDEKPAWPDAAPADSPSKGREKRKPPIIPVDMPAGYGFKRTRSAARIELQRSSSSVSAVAEAVKGLEVD